MYKLQSPGHKSDFRKYFKMVQSVNIVHESYPHHALGHR